MGQISPYLRSVEGGHAHWCPGCEELHVIPSSWKFSGNADRPTFEPSVKITGKQTVVVDGKWTGEWVCGPDGKALDYCCHYILKKGQLNFCSDSTHKLSGQQNVPLPLLPPHLMDEPC